MGVLAEITYEQEKELIELEARMKIKVATEQSKIYMLQKQGALQTDHALKGQRRMLEVMTKSMGGGGVLGTAMAMLQSVGGMGFQNMQDKKSLGKKIQGGTATTEEKSRYDMLSKSGTVGMFEKLDKVFDKNFGGNSKWNKMFAGRGKMAAVGMGVGAVGAGIGLGAKIIDSSPLMQQMLKLLNFGIMLVLRPIGDFFGMLMRPILILLLRKFIIPFYQTVYPWFLNAANTLTKSGDIFESGTTAIVQAVETSGKFMVAKLEPNLAGKNVLGTPDGSKAGGFKVGNLADQLTKRFPKIFATAAAASSTSTSSTKTNTIKSKAPFTPQQPNWRTGGKVPNPAPVVKASTKAVNVALKSIKAVDAVMSLPAQIAMKVGKAGLQLADRAIAATNGITLGVQGKAANAAKGALSPAIKPIQGAASNAAAKIAAMQAAKMAKRVVPVVGQVLLAVEGLGTLIQAVAPKEYTAFNKGVRGAAESIGIPDWLTEGALDFVGFGEQSTGQQLVGLATQLTTPNSTGSGTGGSGRRGSTHALGGIISEEIRGFGKSGRRYTFGEGGSEMVTPMSKMGRRSGGGDSGVTVNVTVNGSIYSDRDMLKFQRTIMKAIETSSTRKAKL